MDSFEYKRLLADKYKRLLVDKIMEFTKELITDESAIDEVKNALDEHISELEDISSDMSDEVEEESSEQTDYEKTKEELGL